MVWDDFLKRMAVDCGLTPGQSNVLIERFAQNNIDKRESEIEANSKLLFGIQAEAYKKRRGEIYKKFTYNCAKLETAGARKAETLRKWLKSEYSAGSIDISPPETAKTSEFPSPATQIDWRETCRAAAQAKRQAANTFFANDLGRKIDLNEIHVPLGLIEGQQKPQRRDDFSPQTGSEAYQEAEKLIPLSYDEFCEKVLANSDSPKSKGKRLAVIGEPGAGKTTQLLKIGDRILTETEYLPVWISLAEVKKPLSQYLIENWLRIAAGKLDAAPAEWVKEFQELLSEGKIWLLLDGADEMGIADSLGTLSPQLRERVFDKVRIIISCRLNIWEATGNALSDFDTYKMLDFSYGDGDNCDQVKLFIDKWFTPLNPPLPRGETDPIPNPLPSLETTSTLAPPLTKGGLGGVLRAKETTSTLTPPLTKGGLGGVLRAANLRAALDEPGKERIKDLARNPLRLFLLCLTWEFGQQKLPDTKAELYEVFVVALYDFKKLAFPTTAAQRTNLNAALRRFALTAIEAGYKSILPDWFVIQHLAQPHPELFEKAIELGWLNRVGVDAQNPLKSVYAFYHPSFQEYFAACEIEDWHFFLNHVPQNPQQGIYRIFERQWKEVMLLWMGRKDVDREEKEAFIRALVEFDDGIEDEFYWYRAYFLAAILINEFKDCSLADEIVGLIVLFGWSVFYIEKQNSQTLLYLIAEGAKAVLPESDRIRAIPALTELIRTLGDECTRLEAADSLGKIDKINPDAIAALTELLGTSENKYIRFLAAVSLGEIGKGNSDAIAALTELISTSENKDTRRLAAESLGEIDEGNPDAVATLIELISTSENEYIRWQAATSLGEIGKSNPDAIVALTELIRTCEDEDTRRWAAESLGEIDEGNPDAIAALTKLIRTTEDEDTRRWAAAILGKIGKANPDALAALTELIRTSEDEDTRQWVAESLGVIGKVNPDVIATLIELICTSEDESIRLSAAESLGEIHKGNSDAIATLTELIRTSENESIRKQAAYNLGKIDEGNPDAIATLTELIRTSENESIRKQAAYNLGKIDKGNPDAIAALTELIRTSENESTRKQAADSLKEVLTETQQITGVVTALKDCLSEKTYENDFDRCENSYAVIWHCAQNLPYPTFYDAWHYPPTTPHPQVPNWQTFPQDIAREINNQAELSNQIQLLCIDSKNFINPDNPATKIYTQMLKQGCPKCEDGTPKTMADLQTYWDLLLMDSEKSCIFVFYNSRGEEATGFSETFVNDLSKFDGNIAIVGDYNADSLTVFSPSQSDMIGAIVRWICQIVWES
ncbi:HEAT repeat domain-containing protein [Microcoleus sp. bin38.metabat.b11b12b14.051]|uniref:HEAT repeat domain-containing protein n=1 Tax=Microcoleus sp. bin38.metabat.b11b12b14.051 TaxID=2742709 RepID=UPI0025E2A0EF|nr:HEAT repeat domain-containing protein [Microcoleus sp. bin38.metabat.b11b12b14.051]